MGIFNVEDFKVGKIYYFKWFKDKGNISAGTETIGEILFCTQESNKDKKLKMKLLALNGEDYSNKIEWYISAPDCWSEVQLTDLPLYVGWQHIYPPFEDHLKRIN